MSFPSIFDLIKSDRYYTHYFLSIYCNSNIGLAFGLYPFLGGVNLWSDEDVDQSSIDFRHYRYDPLTAEAPPCVPFHNSHLQQPPTIFHFTSPPHHCHRDSPAHQHTHFNSSQLHPRYRRRLNRNQRPQLHTSNRDTNDTSTASNVWKAPWYTASPVLSSSRNSNRPNENHPSTSQPPRVVRGNLCNHDSSEQAVAGVDSSQPHGHHYLYQELNDSGPPQHSNTAHRRRGRQRTFGRQEFGGTRSVEPRQCCRIATNVPTRSEGRTVVSTHFPNSTVVRCSNPCIKKTSSSSVLNKERRSLRCRRKYQGSRTPAGLTSPCANTSNESYSCTSLDGMSKSSSNAEVDSSAALGRASLGHRSRANSRSIADFRSPRDHLSTSGGRTLNQTRDTQGGPSSTAVAKVTSDEEALFDSFYRCHPPKLISGGSRVAHTASGEPRLNGSMGPHSSTGRTSPMIGGVFRRWQRQSMRDELIEVVAVRSLFHLGQIQVSDIEIH